MKLILLVFLIAIFSSCQFSRPIEDDPINVSARLVKSFVTKDTTLFYSAVEIDSLAEYFNKSDTIKYRKFDVRNIFFLMYAPLKLSPEKLAKRRMSPVPLSYFALDEISADEKLIKTTVKWAETEKDSLKSLVLTLYEKESKVWKIKMIDFPTDSVTN